MQDYARCDPRYAHIWGHIARSRSPISAPAFAGPLASVYFQQSTECICLLSASSCLVLVSPTPHTRLIFFIPACTHLPHVLILVITVRRISPRHGPPPKASIWCRHPSWRWPRRLSGRAFHVALPRFFMRRGQWQLAISVCIGANSPSAVVSFLSTCRTRSCCFCAPVSLRRTSAAGGSHAACHVATHASFFACLCACCARECDCAGSMFVCTPVAPYVCFAPAIAAACV